MLKIWYNKLSYCPYQLILQKEVLKLNRRKAALLISVVSLILIVGAVMFFVLRPSETEPEIHAAGEAVAVAVTEVISLDGLTEFGDIFDELYNPVGLALLGDYLVVADSMCDRVQIMGENGNERVGIPGRFGLAYNHAGAFVDGFREYAMFMKPAGVSVTGDGVIIVADTGNHAIRQIIGQFVITIAGNGFPGFADGPETSAQFNEPRAAVMCPNGYIYVADTLNNVIRRIDPEGYVRLFAGAPGQSGFVDGPVSQARFFQPSGLYMTGDGRLYVADSANHSIRRIQNGVVSTIAGRPGEQIRFSDYFEGGFVDGPNEQARFNFPRDVAMLEDGSLVVADSLNHAIRMITTDSTRTLVGSGAAGLFHHSVENLRITRPEGVAANGDTLFVSDTMNNRVLSIPLTDRVLAGRPSRGQMLAETGLTTDSRFAFRGDIRVFMGEQRIDMGRVQPWIVGESIFVPVRPLMEALGAVVHLNEQTGILSIYVDNTITRLELDSDYFIMRGVMVTTLQEIMRLFPFTIEWFPELSLITVHIPYDLRGEQL